MSKRNIIHFYKKHESMKYYICFYCDSYGQSKDHVPPISYQLEVDHRIIVRACLLCNSLLGNKAFFTLKSRCEYLLIRLKRRFFKTLSMPTWTEEEINELSGKLKRTIILGLKKKKDVERRLLHLEELLEKLDTKPLHYFIEEYDHDPQEECVKNHDRL